MLLKWIKKQRLKFKLKMFDVAMTIWKRELQTSGAPLIYPLIVDLEFNYEWYKERYMRGISIKESLDKRIDLITKKMSKDMNKRHSDDTYRRLARIRRNKEDRLFFEECEKLADEYDNK